VDARGAMAVVLDGVDEHLEGDVLPAYADRQRWIGMMQASIETVQERFSSDRMVEKYFAQLYAC